MAIGAVAYLIGYVVTYLSAVDATQRAVRAFQPLADAGGRFAPAWKVAGWTFYDAHFVGTRFAGRTVNLVSLSSVEFLYLAPPVLLLLAGAAGAYTSRREVPQAGLTAGMTVVLGYLPFVGILAVLVQHANIQPGLVRALVIAGIVYPVAFGGIGGALMAVVQEDSASA